MTAPYTLREYQQKAVDAGVAYLRDPKMKGRHGLIVAPTGSGKSLYIAAIATQLDGPCVVFQPSREILEQNAQKLAGYGYRAAIFSASFGRRERGTITLATIGSVTRHAALFKDYPYVLVDEAHLVGAKGGMYRDFLSEAASARVLGLTATPFRLASSGGLGSMLKFLTRTRPRIFRDVVHCTQLQPLFRDGFLAPLEYHAANAMDYTGLRLNSSGSDFRDDDVQQRFKDLDFPTKLQAAVESQLAAGRRTVLVFTRFIEESRELAKRIPGAAVVTGETPAHERAQILRDFRAGAIKVIANVGVLTLGFDFPALECVVLARPTLSLALYYQMTGRVLRPSPGKRCGHVVDLVGLVDQFGRFEDLILRREGPRGTRQGENFFFASGTRPLTNVLFGPPRPGYAVPAWAERQRRFA